MLVTGSTYHRTLRSLAASLATLAALLVLLVQATSAAAAQELVIEGGGYGHGVGMSQEGALGYAEHGFSYQQILAHYYTGTALGTAPANTKVRVLVGGKVQAIAMETYVRGVVSAEVSASWPLAALEAQAVASRTYALTAHAGGTKFDVYADTRSQVYRGVAAQTPQTNAAVAATAGQVVTYQGKPVATYFFASSGGRTENVENSFVGSQPEPWLRGVVDQYERGDHHTWKTTLSFATAASRLHGLVRGSFEGVEVITRGFSPRIVSAYVLGSSGRTAITGPALAERLGLYSAWAYFSTREGQALKPEPDRSGWSAALTSPAPAASPGAPSSEQGGASPTEASASAASSGAAPSGMATSGSEGDSRGGAIAPS
ncbi:MAG TPA: SpoIID/LytB domain-containing protein [Solirubrobacteraceae bacterium]|jgi:stage II sporulation protein D|nr:SpoIID/LytB domain-containing protein [Solirubrobacteraceae bacterium]